MRWSIAQWSLTVWLFGLKNDASRSGFEVCIPKATDPKVDPSFTLRSYISRTERFRDCNNKAVFLTLNPPYKALAADTVASVLQSAIDLVGLKGFTPKSFRSSAATAAVTNGVSPETAMQIGRWKTSEVFFGHYVYPSVPEDYVDNIQKFGGSSSHV